MGAGEAAERKGGGRKGAREGRAQERLAEKGLRGHGTLSRPPPAPHAAKRRVQVLGRVLREEGALSALGSQDCVFAEPLGGVHMCQWVCRC